MSDIQKQPYGKTAEGNDVYLYTCTNGDGMRLKLTDWGATVVALEAPDRHGRLANVTLGFQDLKGYLRNSPYFGCTVGRYANRIARGRFELDGQVYQLATNNGPNHLHGGRRGFSHVLWQGEPVQREDAVGVRFTYFSPDGEEGYPGNLHVWATYLLTAGNALRIELEAVTDDATVINLTNHCYWNLAGAGQGTILDHLVQLEADHYLPVDETLIPTGELASVKGTPFDFTEPHAVGGRLDQVPLKPKGYDHCFVLRGPAGTLRRGGEVLAPRSGRRMEFWTTQPGVQFYTGNFLDGSEDVGGFIQYGGLCLETQHFPDSPNKPHFPSTVLRPGQRYRHVSEYRFRVSQ